MYSKKDRIVNILYEWTREEQNSLADTLLTYLENPEKFPSLTDKYWQNPEDIINNTEESREKLLRLLLKAKFNVSPKALESFLSRLNNYADELEEKEEKVAQDIYASMCKPRTNAQQSIFAN